MKELEETNNWESAVEIEAAMIAASSSPQIPAGKNLRAIAMKVMISQFMIDFLSFNNLTRWLTINLQH